MTAPVPVVCRIAVELRLPATQFGLETDRDVLLAVRQERTMGADDEEGIVADAVIDGNGLRTLLALGSTTVQRLVTA